MRTTSSDRPEAAHSAEFELDLRSIIADLQAVDDRLAGIASSLVKPSSLHDEKGRLLWISTSASKLLGVNPELAASQSPIAFLSAIHVQDRVKVAHFLANCETDSRAEPIELRRADAGAACGEPQWIEVSKALSTGARSGHAFALVTYRDITIGKHNELNAIRVKEKTEEANDAKSKFLANISHELRTPLNAILGFSELLNSPVVTTFSDEKKIEYTGLIHESAKHLLNLLNSILDMSKIENGMYEIFPESFCLRTSLESTTAIMRGQAELRGIRLQLAGVSDLPDVIADERAIRQIMINLLSNAIKFSNDNSVVEVVARRLARTVEICVKDSGVGISEDHLANLGQPFFQADSKYDRKYEGTGLGLSVVKGLIELHKGSIRFESERGSGTNVTISFPINGRSGRQIPASEKIESVVSINRETPDRSSSLRLLRNTA